MSSPVDLQSCGYKLEFHTASEKLEAMDSGSALYQAELAKAQMHWDSARAVVRYRAMTQAHYIDCPPLLFALLVNSSGAPLKLALGKCKKAWEAICYCESQRHKFKEVMAIWQCLPWASWEICREVFVLLAEFDFEWICPPCMQLITSIFSSWGSSLVNELGFRAIRARCKQAATGKVSPCTSWYSLASSDVMDQFGRRHLHMFCCSGVFCSVCAPHC